MSECQGLFGRLFGHSYRAIFDVFPPEGFKVEYGRVETIERLISQLTRHEYVYTRCTRCGQRLPDDLKERQ